MRINRISPRNGLRRRRKKHKLSSIVKCFGLAIFFIQCYIFSSTRKIQTSDGEARSSASAPFNHDARNKINNPRRKNTDITITNPSTSTNANKSTSSSTTNTNANGNSNPSTSTSTITSTSTSTSTTLASGISDSNSKSVAKNSNNIVRPMRTLANTNQHHTLSKCPRDLKQTELTTTLVTQTTLDRLQLLKATCQRWSSSIIAVVYITPEEQSDSWSRILKEYEYLCPHMKMIPYVALNDDERDNTYPINHMRNMGLDEVKTSHVLLIDADFIPSVDLDTGVQRAIQLVMEKGTSRVNTSPSKSSYMDPGIEETGKENGNSNIGENYQESISSRVSAAIHHLATMHPLSRNNHLHALVVPAYERKFDKSYTCGNLKDCLKFTQHNPEFVPRTMSSLSECVNAGQTMKAQQNATIVVKTAASEKTNVDGTTKSSVIKLDAREGSKHSKCIVFHSDYFPKGHRNTQSDGWLNGMDQNTIRSIPCIDDGYEPYVVIPWCPTEHLNHDNHIISEADLAIDAATNKAAADALNARTNSVRAAAAAAVKSDETASETGIQVVHDKWKPISPYYDERFYGYGKNKIQLVLHLRARGYEFAVIPANGFLTHHPHPVSNTRKVWKESKTKDKEGGMQTKMTSLYKQYKAELKKEYEGKMEIWTQFCPKEKVAQVEIEQQPNSIESPISILASLALILFCVSRFVRKRRKWYAISSKRRTAISNR